MSSVERLGGSLAPHASEMFAVVRSSIRHGLTSEEPRTVFAADFAAELRPVMASFVTLRVAADLRGCIGTVVASRPLVEDLCHNAFMAAFGDPRFDPLSTAEFEALHLEISVLGPPAPISFRDEDELAAMLVPGRDGLILEKGSQRGLFLPQVWDSLPEPAEFLRYLKEKAGLPPDALAAGVRAQRFAVARFEE